jgi:Immunity protein 49
MSRILSKLTREMAEHTLQRSRPLLAVHRARFSASSDLDERRIQALHIASLRLALAVSAYVLERPDPEVIAELRGAAEARAAQWAPVARGEVEDGEVWSLLLLDLGLITAFGSERARLECAQLPLQAIELTDDGELVGRDVVVAWLALLRGERPELDAAIERAAASSDPWLHGWVQGIARGLRALSREDPEELARGLALIAEFNTRQALHGDWQLSDDGPISTPGLGLCRLARERGLRIELDSPYLPLSLLKGP